MREAVVHCSNCYRYECYFGLYGCKLHENYATFTRTISPKKWSAYYPSLSFDDDDVR